MFRSVMHHGGETCEGIVAETESLRDNGEREIRGCQAADDQDADLDDIGITDHLHSAQGNNQGEDTQEDHYDVEVLAAQEAVNGNGAKVDYGGKVDENVEKQ